MRFLFVLFIAIASLTKAQAEKSYTWKFGLYLAPQFYQFSQKAPSLGNVNGNSFIYQNLQMTVQRKFPAWIFDLGINYSRLELSGPQESRPVDLYNVYVGGLYRNWIFHLAQDRVPLIDSSSGTEKFEQLTSKWIIFGYRQTVFTPKFKYYITLGLPFYMDTSLSSVNKLSGYKLTLGGDYRHRFRPSWDFFIRPFIEHNSLSFHLKGLEGKNEVSTFQSGLRFGVNKFF